MYVCIDVIIDTFVGNGVPELAEGVLLVPDAPVHNLEGYLAQKTQPPPHKVTTKSQAEVPRS